MNYPSVDRLAELAAGAMRDGIAWPVTWDVLRRRLRPALRDDPAVEQRLYSAWCGTVERRKRRRERTPRGTV